MNSVEQTIKQMIQKGKGNILAIGTSNSMNLLLEKNKEITTCDVLSKITFKNGKRRLFHKPKSFHLKKMRKTFHKKQKDMLIGDIQEFQHYYKRFIPDSVYITKGIICLYTTSNSDLDLFARRYYRYIHSIQTKICKDGKVIIIEIGDAKNHFWKDKIYYIIDVIIEFIDIIGDVLIN